MLISSDKKIVLVTMGDPAGVGPEVIAGALRQARLARGVEIVVIGNQHVWQRVWKSKARSPLLIHIADQENIVHRPGVPTRESGRDSLLYLDAAINLLKAKKAISLVTAPVCKESINHYVPGFKGHTTYLADAFGRKRVEMMFVSEKMNLVLVTRHVPVHQLSQLITAEKVTSVIKTADLFLREKLGILAPKIAVLGLNPHAGEGGLIGQEEVLTIIPVIGKLKSIGMDINGPFAADTFFEPRNCKGYHLVIAMYHDQGLIALKALYFDSLVNMTIGLPFTRTSPVHGTAFGIAGKGKASWGSLYQALKLAARL